MDKLDEGTVEAAVQEGRLHISVTAKDIVRARAHEPTLTNARFTCPIAQALVRMGHEKVMVYTSWVAIFPPRATARYAKIPERARDFIFEFDSGRPVEPFEFDIVLQNQHP